MSRRKRGKASNPLFIIPDFFWHFPNELWVLLENAKKNLVFHFGVGRHASFPQKPVVKCNLKLVDLRYDFANLGKVSNIYSKLIIFWELHYQLTQEMTTDFPRSNLCRTCFVQKSGKFKLFWPSYFHLQIILHKNYLTVSDRKIETQIFEHKMFYSSKSQENIWSYFRVNLQTPSWSVLNFWKINLGKSSSMNWIFSLFQTWFLLPV